MTGLLLFATVGLFAAVGTGLRVLASTHETDNRQRLGTLAVNVAGALLLGFVTARFGDMTLAVVGAGLLGSFTTFSSMIGQTVQAWDNGARGNAVGYLIASVAGGLFAAWCGLQLGNFS